MGKWYTKSAHGLLFYVLILFLLLCIFQTTAFAQYYNSNPPSVNPIKVEEYHTEGVSTILESHTTQLMGDHIDLDTGELTINQTDVALKGNSELIVQISRTLNSDMYKEKHFGQWSLDIPRISTRVPRDEASPSNRCSTIQGFNRSKSAYSGAHLTIPNRDSGVFIRTTPSSSETFFSSNAPEYTTTNFTRIECENTAQGEIFKVVTPNGEIYKFDKFFTFQINTPFADSEFEANYFADLKVAYPTQITDVNGNWVRYQYSDSNRGPTKIYSNDGRAISIKYVDSSSTNISSVTTNGRTWTYTNSAGKYHITRPDGLSWKIGAINGLMKYGTVLAPACHMGGFVSIEHPDGVKALFKTKKIINFRAHVPGPISSSGRVACNPYEYTHAPYHLGKKRTDSTANFFSAAVEEKTLTFPDGKKYKWSYIYDEGDMFNSYSSIPGVGPSPFLGGDPEYIDSPGNTKLRTVIGPSGHMTKSWFNRSFVVNQGKLARREIYENQNSTTPLQSEVYVYKAETTPWSSDLSLGYSVTPVPVNMRIMTTPNYLQKTTISMDTGDVFTNELKSGLYGHTVETKTYSNVTGSTEPRITQTEYEHNKSKWILALPKKITQNGREMASYVYDPKGQKTSERRFNAPYATFAYNADGTSAWAKDALGRKTSALMWKRGTAQQIKRPDGKNIYQYVDNNGWLTSTKDAMGQTTNYAHDIMGRLKQIDPPGNWAKTNISYNFSGGGAVQTINKGGSREVITYDAMLRPVLEETRDLYRGEAVYVNTKYDAMGRVRFKSRPSVSASINKGMEFTYDGLGRILTERETVAPYAQTSHYYYSLHRHRVYDPSGSWTQYYSRGYDGPGSQDYRFIFKSGNGSDQYTQIFKNIHGQMTRLRQWGYNNGLTVDKSQHFYYDSKQRLCRHYVPEHGATRYQYDLAGQLTGYAKGQGNYGCGNIGANNAKVSLTYDLVGQVTKTDFAGATPDITRLYDDNGNVTRISRGATRWDYTYDDVNHLTSETLQIDGLTFPIAYRYNYTGFVDKRFYPRRNYYLTLDGLGRERKVRAGSGDIYADNITYHSSGPVKSLTYGNGHQFTQTLNARLLPGRTRVKKGAVTAFDRAYGYDERAKLTRIYNYQDSAYNQAFTYDGLGQLKTARGKWGTGSFTYDSLGNILTKTLGSRTVAMNYDGRNRLSAYTDSAAGTKWSPDNIRRCKQGPCPQPVATKFLTYDARGNVIALGSTAFIYDLSDQPVRVTGAVNGTYVYDGNLKRVKSTVDGKTIYNVYNAAGSLVHVYDADTNEKTDYVRAGGMTVARASNQGDKFLHNDHLGSAASITDKSGQILGPVEHFTPFGEALTPNAANDNHAAFTGHIRDKATGLTYMQARYYDPVIGRFLSVDPVTFMDTGAPGMFNRYAYVENDPINMIDPDGEEAYGFNFDYKVVASGGVRVAGEVSFDTETKQLRMSGTFGEHLGAKIKGTINLFKEPSSDRPNSISVSSSAVVEGTAKINAGSLDVGLNPKAALEVAASTETGLTANPAADLNGTLELGALSADENGRTSLGVGGGLGVTVGVDHQVDININLNTTSWREK